MKKRMIIIMIMGAIAIIGALGSVLYRFIEPTLRMSRDADQLRTRLLCETDHQALLDACRELMRQVASGTLKNGGVYAGPEISRFPEPIPTLRPDHVSVDKDIVKIEMMYTGWLPVGVYAYAKGFPEHLPPFKYGDRKLLEGLWYYDDAYGVDPVAYDKQIDELLGKCGKLQRGKSPQGKGN
jgi:hypothetical protein